MKTIENATPHIKKQLNDLKESLSDKEKLVLGSFIGVILNYKGTLGIINKCEANIKVMGDPKHTVIVAPSIYNIVGCIDHETRELKVNNNNWQIVYLEELVGQALNGDINSLRILFHSSPFMSTDIKLVRKGIIDAFSNKYMRARFLLNIMDELRTKIYNLEDADGSIEFAGYQHDDEVRRDELLCCVLDHIGKCVALGNEFNKDELSKSIRAAKYDIVETKGVNIDFLGKIKQQYKALDELLKTDRIYEYANKESSEQTSASIMMYRYNIMKPIICNILDESNVLKYRSPGEESYKEMVVQLTE